MFALIFSFVQFFEISTKIFSEDCQIMSESEKIVKYDTKGEQTKNEHTVCIKHKIEANAVFNPDNNVCTEVGILSFNHFIGNPQQNVCNIDENLSKNSYFV